MAGKTASVIATGNEVTDGQIFNANANWFARELTQMGYRIRRHLAVPDDRDAIQQAIAVCEFDSDVIIISGGLGPTSDDLTREALAQYLHLPLREDGTAWTRLQEKIRKRGVPLRPGHRRQAQFPEGARIYPNTEGTADAFSVMSHGRHFFVFPGPPREIRAVWDAGIERAISALLVGQIAEQCWLIKCLGLAESQVAALTEEVFAALPVRLGYRIHWPYVEIKIWVLPPIAQETDLAYQRLQEKLGKAVVATGEYDFFGSLRKVFSVNRMWIICDEVSEGWFEQRVRESGPTSFPDSWSLTNDARVASLLHRQFPQAALLHLKLNRDRLWEIEMKVPLSQGGGWSWSVSLLPSPRFARETRRAREYWGEVFLILLDRAWTSYAQQKSVLLREEV